MGFFNKRRNDGLTHDGQGEERRGLIDRIKYEGEETDIVWKFPYDNLSTGAQLIVNHSQEAIFVSNGTIADIFEGGKYTLDAHNIPIIQKLINLPFGGRTPFTAEVWYVNMTPKRNLKFGIKVRAHDTYFKSLVDIKGYGQYGIRVTDSGTLIRELVGTMHLFDTESITENFRAKINELASSSIQRYVSETGISVSTQMSTAAPAISGYIRQALQEEFNKYGLQVENFNFESLDADVGKQMQGQQAGSSERARLDALGIDYRQERQFDILETAAGNEGSAGQTMGAGIGLGMGFGMGNVFGTQMNQMAGNIIQQPTAPPPPPALWHILLNGAQQGPHDISQMDQMVQSGILTRDTYVWKAGMPQWAKACDCPELQNLFSAIPPPPPPGI